MNLCANCGKPNDRLDDGNFCTPCHDAANAPKIQPRPISGFHMLDGSGNAVAIIARFRKAARMADVPDDVIRAVTKDACSADYDHLLQVFLPWENDEEDEDET